MPTTTLPKAAGIGRHGVYCGVEVPEPIRAKKSRRSDFCAAGVVSAFKSFVAWATSGARARARFLRYPSAPLLAYRLIWTPAFRIRRMMIRHNRIRRMMI